MSKQKKKNNLTSKNKLFQLLILIVILAFVILIFSDILKKKTPVYNDATINKVRNEVYKFKKEGELTFQSIEGNFIDTIEIEFADNEHERAQGLMYRTEMSENHGMLFIFPSERPQSFWMKNTVISLDMFFINSKFEIVKIHKNTQPYSVESYPSERPAQYVLETIAGYSDKHKISEGDKVIFRKTN